MTPVPMRELLGKLRDWLRRDQLDAELSEELRFHRQRLERDALAAGAAIDDARRLAAHRIGNDAAVRESTRDEWSVMSLDQLQQDLRQAVRGLARAPGFTATVIITLALGIGANAAMFGVVDRLMFRPLAYLRDPGSVRGLYWQTQDRGKTRTAGSMYYTSYVNMQKLSTSFSQLAGYADFNVAVGDGKSARERRITTVSASFFPFFDAQPALGRFFRPDEDVVPRGADVAVLSYAFWQSEFGGRDVRGERLQIGDFRATIIGVAPRGFNGVNDGSPPAAFVPITTFAGSQPTNDAKTYYTRYQWGWMSVLVRLKPGVTIARAEADATQAFRQMWVDASADDPGNPPVEVARPRVVVSAVRPGAGPSPALTARTALWVSGVAMIVLLIAAANVGNLFLARALRRHRETAVRLALGVSRARLVRQWVTESLLVALVGGTAALLVAQWAGAAIRGILMPAANDSETVFTDWRTIGVTLTLTILTGTVVGMIPALMAGRGDLAGAFRGGARGGHAHGGRLRASLLIVQATLSVALLVGAALFVRSLSAVEALPMGYNADPVLFVRRVIRGNEFTDSTQLALRRTLLVAAQSLPNVESAAWVSSAPFLSTSTKDLFVEGIDSVGRLGSFSYQATTSEYFRTMQTRIIRGRPFTKDDGAGSASVAVISESMARALWPTQDAIGRCFRMAKPTAPCVTVVGVAEDMVQRAITGTERFHYYIPSDQYAGSWGNGLLLRMRGDPALAVEGVRAALQRVIPGTSYVTVRPLREVVSNARVSWRMGATLFVAFGILALVVAAVGLYGVIGYNVAQRMHELGVRIALGAQRNDIVRLVVAQSVAFALAGVALGLMVVWVSSRWMQPLLFHQSARDPLVYGAVGLGMLVVAVAAATVPALRAARADPNTALRLE
jgi:putative ABC transport system permease protein